MLLFVDRQLASILNEVSTFHATDVAASDVTIGSNAIKILLTCPSKGADPATIRIELQARWLVATIEPGWVRGLGERERRIFDNALAGFYKRAGIDIVREQLEDALHAMGSPPYDLDGDHLVVWPGEGYRTEIVYRLHTRRLRYEVRGAPFGGEPIRLRPTRMLFARQPVYWSVWSTTWNRTERGEEPVRVLSGGPLLPHV